MHGVVCVCVCACMSGCMSACVWCVCVRALYECMCVCACVHVVSCPACMRLPARTVWWSNFLGLLPKMGKDQ